MRLIGALEELVPGLEVHVLLARKHRPTSSAVPKHWQVEVALPPDYFFYMNRPRFLANLVPAVLRVARAARKADLVHAIKDYPHNYAGLLGARIAGKPCIATAHGTYTIQPLLDRRHAARAARAYRRFAALICVSGHTRDRLFDLLGQGELPRERVHVIPNAVDAEHYRAQRELGPRAWHGVPFTLAIGELKERKGHHLSLAAWCRVAARHRTLEHFVIGKLGGDEYEARLRSLVDQAGLSERVHFLGNVSEDEKIDLLQRAQLFVHTPVDAADGGFEGFGLVYLEAAASGTPSIGTRGSGAEDAIVDGQSGLLVEPTIEAVSAALERLLEDAGLRERMRIAGRELALHSSWAENAQAVLALYREALQRR